MGDRSGRVLLMPIGTAGDVHPLVAIAAELRGRGVDVLVHASPHFAGTIERAGVPSAPFEHDMSWNEVVQSARKWSVRTGLGFVTRMRQRWAPGVVHRFNEALPVARAYRPDVVVGNSICLQGQVIAESMGATWFNAALSPTYFLSVDDPPLLPGGLDVRRAPRWFRRAHHLVVRTATSLAMDPTVNGLRREVGLGPRRDNFFGAAVESGRSLALYSPEIRGVAPDDPPGLVPCGFVWHDRSGEHGEQGERLDPALERFLDAGEPPVIVSPGTVRAHQTGPLFDTAIRACAALGRRAVLVTGHDHGGRYDGLPGTIRVDYAPYSALLHRGAVTIHHGGTGTMAWCLRSGRPMIVTPMAFDQYDHGERVRAMGVGDARRVRRIDERWLAARIDALAGDPAVARRCAEVAERVAREDGAGVAADAIQGALASRKAAA
jgi:rhamnosyltransferase subunit B